MFYAWYHLKQLKCLDSNGDTTWRVHNDLLCISHRCKFILRRYNIKIIPTNKHASVRTADFFLGLLFNVEDGGYKSVDLTYYTALYYRWQNPSSDPTDVGTLRRASPFFGWFISRVTAPINHRTGGWVLPKIDLNTVVPNDGKIMPFIILLSHFIVPSIYTVHFKTTEP
jgi:hypothetical protein